MTSSSLLRVVSIRDKNSADQHLAYDWEQEHDFLSLLDASNYCSQLRQDKSHSPATMWHFITHVIVQKDAKESKASKDSLPAVKVVRFARKKSTLSTEEFRDYWCNVHGPIASASPFLRRYEQLHLHDSEYSSGKKPLWDGFTLSYFDSLATMAEHAKHPAGQAAAQDTQNFLALEPSAFIILEN